MNEHEPARKTPVSMSRWVRRFRVTGALVLLLGLGGAGLVYWRGIRTGEAPVDESLIGYSKVETRQMEIMYGKQGLLLEDLKEDLQQPGNQAFLIAAAAAVLSGGCFYLARLWAEDGGPDDGMNPG
jgi:hypothetical protein